MPLLNWWGVVDNEYMPALDTSSLRSKLKLKHLTSDSILRAHHGPTVSLLEASGIKPGKLRSHAQKLLTSTILAGTLLVAPGQSSPTLAALPPASETRTVSTEDLRLSMIDALDPILPKDASWQLNENQEQSVAKKLHEILGIHAYAELEGNRLNNSYGLIGAEQHLPRFPGDTVVQHDAIQKAGITPGRGAWGYFAYNKAQLTPDLVEKERYYVAVQTLYLPDWTTRLAYLRDWYKYRKVVVVNPANGRTVVAVVADSGPAAWTGKHFGGSPEVMDYLHLNVGKQKGAVVLFFVDDPDDKIPLGPVEHNLENKLSLPA